ncbi:uncharacterized protein LOC135498776 [Lineus longissimus]|uniref:uncharacterized protein LOC135498776 n=1 Tax=Lineus longissimus TaxID=88925 RepID=UPI00315C9A62
MATNPRDDGLMDVLNISLDKSVPVDSSSVMIIQSKQRSEVFVYGFSDIILAAKVGQAKFMGQMVLAEDMQETIDFLKMVNSDGTQLTPSIGNLAKPMVVHGVTQVTTETSVGDEPARAHGADQNKMPIPPLPDERPLELFQNQDISYTKDSDLSLVKIEPHDAEVDDSDDDNALFAPFLAQNNLEQSLPLLPKSPIKEEAVAMETGPVSTAMMSEDDDVTLTGAMGSSESKETMVTSDVLQTREKQLGFICRTCGEKFISRTSLDTHKCSINKGTPPIGCQRCHLSKAIDPKTGTEKLMLKLCDTCKETLKPKILPSSKNMQDLMKATFKPQKLPSSENLQELLKGTSNSKILPTCKKTQELVKGTLRPQIFPLSKGVQELVKARGLPCTPTETAPVITTGAKTIKTVVNIARGGSSEVGVVKTPPSLEFGAGMASANRIIVERASGGNTSIGAAKVSMVTETSAVKGPIVTMTCAVKATKTGLGKSTTASKTSEGKAARVKKTGAGMARDDKKGTVNVRCDECGKDCKSKKRLRTHKLIHQKMVQLCQYCGKGFVSKGKRLEHERIHTGEKPFKCTACIKEFRNRASWRKHIRNEHTLMADGTEPSYSCNQCHKSYKRKDVLTQHVRHVHSPYSDRPHKCQLCPKAFWTTTKIRNHMRMHTGEKNFVCEQCEHRYATPQGLKAHMKTVHGVSVEVALPLFQCGQCDKRYHEKKNLFEHMNVHTGATPYKCRECDEAFASASGRRFHEDKHRPVDPKRQRKSCLPSSQSLTKECVCVHCHKVLPSRHALSNHMVIHNGKGYMCAHCNDAFAQRRSLMKHMNLVHIKTFKCRLCSLKFTSLSRRATHERKHRPNRSKPKVSFKCSLCSKIFHERQVGLDHMNLHTGAKPYKCSHEDCEAAFGSVSGRRNHERLHNATLLKCLICKKQFREQSSLKDHMNLHTGATPYDCRHCEQTFPTRSARSLHEHKHTEGADYKCQYCYKSFAAKRGLEEHLNLHTGVTPHECQYCKQTFTTKYKLRHHWRTCKLNTEKVEFKCSVCQKSFYSQQICDDHMNTHTGAKPYQCRVENCSQTFHTASSRKSHESLKHKKVCG